MINRLKWKRHYDKLMLDILRAVNGEDSYGATHEKPLA
jgi:hypothetical protein